MATPRLPFLYPNLMRTVRSCEPATHRSVRIPSRNGHAPFHTTRRWAQETYHRRYGPAAEANLPPPSRPKSELNQPQVPQPAPKDTNSPPNTAPPEKLPPQDTKSNTPEVSSQAKDQETPEPSDKKQSDEPSLHEEPASESHDVEPLSASPTENAEEPHEELHDMRDESPNRPDPLDDVLHMPSPSSYLMPSGTAPSETKPHLTPPPYIHHFDTFSLVRDLTKGGFTEDQSVTIMKAVRNILHNNLDMARQNLTSKSDVENESYLFKAACSELQSSLQTARNSEMQRQRASRTQLQHEADILSQRTNQELAGLKDDIKAMFNDHNMTMREQQRSTDTSVQELNYKITVSLNSDGKSEIEGLRWILTRRAAFAIAASAFMIISFLKFYSSRKAQDAAEKKKKASSKKATEKQAAKAPVVVAAVPVPEVYLTESLG
ncbi:hypothetical protein BDV26DRAFT_273300 [Aspergillus bertholletiae]|uniref:MOZ protein represents a chromatin-associated acetyltransferase n=1 Tax=Aspergillus bertholletiae TaxID=1226010 RepID=A0A5N7AVB3_9EURO|nr:hypothetical protein BDV26DRAFT_273300 [Aspergillus bertholletiae]